MYESDYVTVPLSENLQNSRKFKLTKDSKLNIVKIKDLLVKLNKAESNAQFDEILKAIHGRFSKIELNLIELEKIKYGKV